MTIKIKIDSNIYDVSNDVIVDSIDIGKRADFSFEVGSFKMYTSLLHRNIPPYSLCQITHDTGTDYYLISSEATAYFTTGKWVHDCSLLSLEAIMECYILGAKTFSLADSPKDSEVFGKIMHLINQSVGSTLFVVLSNTYNKLYYYSNEYTFPDGTTLYYAVKEIANKNKLGFSVSIYQNDFSANATKYQINFFDNLHSSYDLTTTKMISFKMLQDSNNYCKYLQCASADVVDRANPTTFRNLTVRASNGVAVNEDTAEIVLPIRVENITKLEIKSTVRFYHFRIYSNLFSVDYINAHNPYHSSLGGYTQTESHTLYDWMHLQDIYASDMIWTILKDEFDLEYYTSNLFVVKKYDNSDNIYVAMVADPHGTGVATEEDLYGEEFDRVVDVTSYIVEDDYFNSLDASEQPKYLVFKSGDNKITNLNASYKNEFWYILFGQNVNGFFETSKQYDEYNSTNTQHLDIKFDFYNGKATPFSATFDVECVPITNPLLMDTKNNLPLNETAFKGITRTYQMGDSNGLLVDFKSLTNDIDTQNDTLGDVEAILELDSEVYYYDDDEDDEFIYTPNPNNKIKFYYQNLPLEFYISSMATKYTNNRKTYQLNLSRTPYKIADAIGVDYQFNPTWLPLDNIVERALYYETRYDNFKNTFIDNENFFLKVVINSQAYYLKPAVMKNNGYYICYCEAIDNIVIGMSTNTTGQTNVKSIENVKYVDENGAFISMTLSFVAGGVQLTNAQLFKLPLIDNHTFSSETLIVDDTFVYKDSREKLTFTIKVNDSYI